VRFSWLLPAPLLAACGLSVVGTATLDGGDTADGGGQEGSPPTRDTSPPCDPSACPGARCERGACSTFVHCADLRDNGPVGVRSGVFLFGGNDGGSFPAYCELTLAGGGWTLIGQSGVGATTSFGWSSATGSVTDLNAPYSLNARLHGLPMSEALLATGTRASIAAAYLVKAPLGFPAGYENSAAQTTITKIQNPSCPTGGDAPIMMRNMGRTALTGQFFFRDMTGIHPSGLFPDGWKLVYPDCTNAGMFTDTPGMLFVR
jgi:hypothetical protein